MKFKACFSDSGIGWLEKRFLPVFEKLAPSKGGVELIVFLTPHSVHLIHDAKAAGGPEIHADFLVAELFEPQSYVLQSAHGNKVAFRLDAAMFRRVLSGLAVSDAARVEVKLTKKPLSAFAAAPPPGTPVSGASAASQPVAAPAATAPFLEVSAAGGAVLVCHGVPLLGDPLRRSAVDECEKLVGGSGTHVPYWLTVPPSLALQLCAEVTSLKVVAATLDMATMPGGDLHLCASTHALTLGTEHRGLAVAWSPGHAPPTASTAPAHGARAVPPTTPGGRLAAARAGGGGGAAEVHLAARDLLLALSFHATKCDALLLGIASHGGFVEVVCRYDDDGMMAAPDGVALGVKLPVKDPAAFGA